MIAFVSAATTAMAHARPSLTAAALALFVLGLLMNAERWRVVLAAAGSPVSLGRAVGVNLAGIFIRNVTPTSALGGDAARVGLFKTAGVPLTDATVTFLCVRGTEIPAIAGLLLVALPVLTPVTRHASAATLAAVGGVLTLAGLALAARAPVGERAAAIWRSLSSTPVSRTALLVATGWAVGAWIETVARLMVIAAALGIRLSLAQGSALAVLSIAGGLVPTIGSLGAIDGGLVAGLVLFGTPVAVAAAITAIERAISYGLATAAGAASLALLGGWDLTRRARRAVKPS